MKIVVTHTDGEQEVLTIVPPIEVSLGDELNRLTDGSVVDYFFTVNGYYDGWGRELPDGATKEDAAAIFVASRCVGISRHKLKLVMVVR